MSGDELKEQVRNKFEILILTLFRLLVESILFNGKIYLLKVNLQIKQFGQVNPHLHFEID